MSAPETETPRGTAYRFTLEDEHRIAGAIAATIKRWKTIRVPQKWKPEPADLAALYREGARAIGCRDCDLREVESIWIRAQVAYAVELSSAFERAVAARSFDQEVEW